jgi:hypothetical protein
MWKLGEANGCEKNPQDTHGIPFQWVLLRFSVFIYKDNTAEGNEIDQKYQRELLGVDVITSSSS